MSKIRKRKCSSNEGINDVYTVETIYKKKTRNNKEPLYFIKWKDWDDKYNTWEPLSNILDQSLIETFEDEIRQKQKLRKEANKNKRLDWDKVDYESDVKSDSADEIDSTHEEKSTDDPGKEEKDKCELPAEEPLHRPKICIKIPKYRLNPPHSSLVTCSFSADFSSPDIETPRNVSKQFDDDSDYGSRVSPSYISSNTDLNKSIKVESPLQMKSPKKHESHKSPPKHLCKLENQLRKPRKLLSINEYSAVIKMKKKHHKKSKHSKHRSENRVFKSLMEIEKPVSFTERKEVHKVEAQRSPEDDPILPIENKPETWPKSRLGEPVLKEIETKLEMNKFKFHSQTTVTDVTVNGLCVTVKEMCYDDFINDSYPRYQLLRVPCNSDWAQRYLGKCEEKQETDSQSMENDDEIVMVEGGPYDEKTSKQRLLDRFEERIIPGLRPPSRPRSVDSYRNIMDKTMYGVNRNQFPEFITSQGKAAFDNGSVCDDVIDKGRVGAKSPLNIVIDECEEVDVVGGIESENSYLSSLQSTRTTVTTQLRQARMTNQSPVSSIIQSLWHSYSYNSPMGMPPLQAAPWVQTQETERPSHSQSPYQLSRPVSQNYLSRSSSIDPTLLKYSQGVVPMNYYQQSSNILSNFFLGTSEETPIDLSFK